MIEKITVQIEKMMANNICLFVIYMIAIASPLSFLWTLHSVAYGPIENFISFKSQIITWYFLTLANVVSFVTTLPSRKKGRVVQLVMLMWTVEMIMLLIILKAR